MIQVVKQIIQDCRNEWETLVWKVSDENREMIHERLKQHDEAMDQGKPGPYFK